MHPVPFPFDAHASVLVVGPESVAFTPSTGPACAALFTISPSPNKGPGHVGGQASPQDTSVTSKHNQIPMIVRMTRPPNVVVFSGEQPTERSEGG